MPNPSSRWNLVPIFGIYLKGDDVTPLAGKVRASMTQRTTRDDGRAIYAEGAVVERVIGDHADDGVIRNAVRDAWRSADQTAEGVDFDGAAWDARWEELLAGAVFFGFPAADDPDIVGRTDAFGDEVFYQVKIEEQLDGGAGKIYYVTPLLAQLDTAPPGINLGLVEVPPGSPSAPAPVYAKGVAGGVASLDIFGKVPASQLPEFGSGDVESVNGQTGVVVLGHADVGADVAGAAAGAQSAAIAAAATDATTKANAAQAAATTAAATAAAGIYQPTSTLAEAVDDRVGALLVAGTNVTLTYNDGSNTLTIAAAAGSGGLTEEQAQDIVGAMATDNTDLDWTYDDTAGTIVAVIKAGAVTNTMLAGSIAQSKVTSLTTDLAAKAPLASPAFTGTPTGITKTHVGLGSVDNTADTAKPVSTAQQTALNLKANLASPAFTGTPTGITKAHVGLGSVDNTADTAKPVSTAQQAALDAKLAIATARTTIRWSGSAWVTGAGAGSTPAWAAIRAAGLNVTRQGPSAQISALTTSAWGAGADSDKKPGDLSFIEAA